MKPRTLISTCIALALLAGPGLSEPGAPPSGFGRAAAKAKPIQSTPLAKDPALAKPRVKIDSKAAGQGLAPALTIDPEVARQLEPGERTPQLDAVESAYEQFKQARTAYSQHGLSYRRQLIVCSRRSYSSSEQREAGCEASDTVQACSQKLLRRCAATAASRFGRSRLTLMVRARNLRGVVDDVTSSFGG